MKVLIVEDETAAFENLANILQELDDSIAILGNTESIRQTLKWLEENQEPDLIFMDIHLSDGSAFSIFDSRDVDAPIIFTTAYDEYAIDAFKVNSIDYLLKPIKKEELRRALEKFRKWTRSDVLEYISRMSGISASSKYKEKFLIPFKDTLQPVDVKDIAFFYSTDKKTSIYMLDGSILPFAKSLEQIQQMLDPALFIRANKQYILSRSCIKNLTIWFDNRLLIKTNTKPPEAIYISKNKASDFKSWMVD